jgi:Dynamin family
MNARLSTDFDAEIAEHLAFARSAAQSIDVDDTEREAFFAAVAAVERRLADPSHYLAVIGEFSSGKSTFLNALLGEDLLPTGNDVTTSAALRIRSGPRRELVFQLGEDDRRHVISEPAGFPLWGHGRASGQARRQLHRIGSPVAEALAQRAGDARGLRPALTVLCADPAVSAAVTALDLALPARVLDDGLVVIDTPGANADDSRHVEVTGTVLEREADAAVVILPAGMPVSDSLVAFLNEALDRDQLARCVFVVSWMDSIPEDERDDLLRSVRRRLLRKLSLREVTVLPAAPLCALQAAQNQPLGPDQRAWADQFPALVETLHTTMRQQRALAAAATVLRLLDTALAAMEARLHDQAGRLDAERQALEKLPIHDVAAFLNAQRTRQAAGLEGIATALESAVSGWLIGTRNALGRNVRSALDEAKSKSALSECMKTTIPKRIQGTMTALERELNNEFSKSARRVSDSVLAGLNKAATDQYQHFTAIARQSVPVSALSAGTVLVDAGSVSGLAGLDSAVATVTSGDNRLTGAGVVTGMAVGTLFFPGVGTLIGGMVGTVARLLGPSADTVRGQYKDVADEILDEAFRQVRAATERGVSDFSAQASAALGRQTENLRAAYAPVIAEAMRLHREQIRRVESDRLRARRDAAVISARRAAIYATRDALAARPGA